MQNLLPWRWSRWILKNLFESWLLDSNLSWNVLSIMDDTRQQDRQLKIIREFDENGRKQVLRKRLDFPEEIYFLF